MLLKTNAIEIKIDWMKHETDQFKYPKLFEIELHKEL